MESIIIKPKNKKALSFLKHLLASLSDVESIEVIKVPENLVAKSISSGLKDVKEILSGKKKGKSLKQLLNED
ncbi:MAG: hypothetical protein K8R85_08220 [Bacteroidetes bacterium]|nr:hypothetical protein [Bacteroidota bacterium]